MYISIETPSCLHGITVIWWYNITVWLLSWVTLFTFYTRINTVSNKPRITIQFCIRPFIHSTHSQFAAHIPSSQHTFPVHCPPINTLRQRQSPHEAGHLFTTSGSRLSSCPGPCAGVCVPALGSRHCCRASPARRPPPPCPAPCRPPCRSSGRWGPGPAAAPPPPAGAAPHAASPWSCRCTHTHEQIY